MGYAVHIVQSKPSEVRASVVKLRMLLDSRADLTHVMDRVTESVGHFYWGCLSTKSEFNAAMDRCERKCACCRTVLRNDTEIRQGIAEVAMRVERLLAEFLEWHPAREDQPELYSHDTEFKVGDFVRSSHRWADETASHEVTKVDGEKVTVHNLLEDRAYPDITFAFSEQHFWIAAKEPERTTV